VLVRELTRSDSPAGRAGIKSGDIITSINGVKVRSVSELIRKIASLPVGSTATIEYVREAERRTASVRLEERLDGASEPIRVRPLPTEPTKPRIDPQRPLNNRGSDSVTYGITARTLTREKARLERIEGAEGALVTLVEPGSVGDRNGIALDDVIVEINAKPVRNEEDFQKLMRQLRRGDDVVIMVLRHDRGPLRRAWIVSFTIP
jgi:serine protease Do